MKVSAASQSTSRHGAKGIERNGDDHNRLHKMNASLRLEIRELKAELKEARDINDPSKVSELKEKLAKAEKIGNQVAQALHSLGNPCSDKYTPVDGKSLVGVSVYLDKDEFMEISDSAAAFLHDLSEELSDPGVSKSSSSSDVNSGDVVKDGAYWLELSRNDPEEFRAQIDNLDDFDKQQAYSDMQNEIQSENRFWSMMTSVQQASHDTAKQIIGNFRV